MRQCALDFAGALSLSTRSFIGQDPPIIIGFAVHSDSSAGTDLLSEARLAITTCGEADSYYL